MPICVVDMPVCLVVRNAATALAMHMAFVCVARVIASARLGMVYMFMSLRVRNMTTAWTMYVFFCLCMVFVRVGCWQFP